MDEAVIKIELNQCQFCWIEIPSIGLNKVVCHYEIELCGCKHCITGERKKQKNVLC